MHILYLRKMLAKIIARRWDSKPSEESLDELFISRWPSIMKIEIAIQ